jgi:predicted nucleic acid-binding Zn ribbon protein
MNIERGNTIGIKEAFNEMLNDYKIDSKYKATIIKKLWLSIMGKTIASRTKKITLHNKKLKVSIESAPLKNELNMSKSKVLAILDKELGKGVIEDIVFI